MIRAVSAARVHTAVALALMTLVVLAPLAMWLYARVASVDRGATVAANERLLRSLEHPRGAARTSTHTYALPRWEMERGLVPVDGYRTEAFYRIADALAPRGIVAAYRPQLTGWRERDVPVSCHQLSLPIGCGAMEADFTRGGVRLVVDVSVTLRRSGRTREYGLYVSQ